MSQPLLDKLATSTDWQLYEGGRVIWPVGAFEQHGPHLPLGTDNLLAEYYSRRLATNLNAALLPVMPFGTSLEHSGFRGTMTLTPALLMALVHQVASEMELQNFTRLIILSGHGGNFSLFPATREWNRQNRKLKILTMGLGETLGKALGNRAGELHAGEVETSIMLAIHPEVVGTARPSTNPTVGPQPFEQADFNTFGVGRICGCGVWGDASKATAEKGHEYVEKTVSILTTHLEERLKRLDEDPSYWGPGPVATRPMLPRDLPVGMHLKTQAHWNQTEGDWRLLLSLGGQGSFLAVVNGRGVGSVTTLNYGGQFAWVGMLLVDSDFRRRGIGTRLLDEAIASAGSVPVRLDATPAGKLLYDTMGFVDEYRLARMERPAGSSPSLAPSPLPAGYTLRAATAADLPRLTAFDAPIFGANRQEVLAFLLGAAPAVAHLVESADGQVAGFVLGRPGSRFCQVGPIVAHDAAVAQALLDRGLAGWGDQATIVDAVIAQSGLMARLSALGFREQRPFIRMVRGGQAPFGQPQHQYAIAGPELA
jgi:creatinine amidohydrolase/Fe(II)-dependent formamide hydrolase-like protein/GNAT superfamily N-acetyltransferase